MLKWKRVVTWVTGEYMLFTTVTVRLSRAEPCTQRTPFHSVNSTAMTLWTNSQTSYHATQTQFSQQGQLFNFPSVLPLLINGWMNGWTPAETQDRKCFSLHLILVMVRWIWSVRFARCYHFVASYCQLILLKKRLLTTSLSTVVTAKCACIRNTNVWFF